MDKIAMIVIFNHRYEKNIPKLRAIYEGRFSHIYFAIPFSEDLRDDDKIIHIWEAGYIFEGGIAPTYERLRDEGFDYYFFLPDDMIINPEINEENIVSYFGIDEKTALFSKLIPMRDFTAHWPLKMFFEPKDKFDRYSGVIYKNLIMSGQDAYKVAERKGYRTLSKGMGYSLIKNGWWGDNIRSILKYPKFYGQMLRRKFTYSYPLVNAFSDIFIIPNAYMREFAKYCGVFGAMNIHAEVAIPTAVLITCDNIKELEGKNVEHGDADAIRTEYGGDLDKLLEKWDRNVDFIHPVKLSGWNYSKIDG